MGRIELNFSVNQTCVAVRRFRQQPSARSVLPAVRFLWVASELIPLVILQMGCQLSLNDRVPVTGSVTLDGAPLHEGYIVFLPEPAANLPMSVGQITDGAFRIATEKGPGVGTHKVEVWPTSPRNVSTSVIPSIYNEFTTLSVTTSVEQINQFHFQLVTIQ